MKKEEEKSLQKLMEDINETKFGSTRFIVPYDWLINALNKPQEIIECKNDIFLSPKKNTFKKNIVKDNMSLVLYEIMEYIISIYKVDYVIKISYNNLQKTIDIDDIDIYQPEYFIKNNISSVEYKKIRVESGYLKPSDFILNTNNNDINNSKNQLLTNSHYNLDNIDDNENDSTKRKNKTDSEKISPSSTNNIKKLSIKTNEKGTIEDENKKNNNENKEESSHEEDTNELHKNEKLPIINKKDYDKNKVEKENKDEEKENIHESSILNIYNNQNQNNRTRNKIEEKKSDDKNKEENENKDEYENIIDNEEYKKYLFNESQLTINLLNYEQESIEPIGLINPRVICFMICVLQTLLSIPELNYFFLTRLYLGNPKNKKVFPKCNAFHHFIKTYLMRKKDSISIPKQLLIICIELLGGMRMHDSQEFLVCFLQALQEELNSDIKYVIPEKASMEQRWIIYRKINNSFIDSVFSGLMRSTVECKNCHHKSQTFDPFIDLSVSINKYSNLDKCLKQFFENEKIDCEYKCDNCKNQVRVSNYHNITKFFIF